MALAGKRLHRKNMVLLAAKYRLELGLEERARWLESKDTDGGSSVSWYELVVRNCLVFWDGPAKSSDIVVSLSILDQLLILSQKVLTSNSGMLRLNFEWIVR